MNNAKSTQTVTLPRKGQAITYRGTRATISEYEDMKRVWIKYASGNRALVRISEIDA